MILFNLTAEQVFLFIARNTKMLTNISVNLTCTSRPGSAHHPLRFSALHSPFGSHGMPESTMTSDKMILQVKEYSNKFLRQHKPKEELIYNPNMLKPKRSLLYLRKEMKNSSSRRNKRNPVNKENENSRRVMKTQASSVSNVNKSQTFAHSVCGVCDEEDQASCSRQPGWKTMTSAKKEKISTSRALEMFSKVFKNQNIERMKIRKEVHHSTSDVQVKRMSLQGKEEKKKIEVGVARRPNIHPAAVLHRTKKKSLLFAEEDNFQLEGW